MYSFIFHYTDIPANSVTSLSDEIGVKRSFEIHRILLIRTTISDIIMPLVDILTPYTISHINIVRIIVGEPSTVICYIKEQHPCLGLS